MGHFASPGDIWPYMEIFGDGVDTGIKWVEARDVTEHPTKHRTATWPKMSMVPRLRNNGLGFANSVIHTPLAAGFWFTFCQWEVKGGERKHPSSSRGVLAPTSSGILITNQLNPLKGQAPTV